MKKYSKNRTELLSLNWKYVYINLSKTLDVFWQELCPFISTTFSKSQIWVYSLRVRIVMPLELPIVAFSSSGGEYFAKPPAFRFIFVQWPYEDPPLADGSQILEHTSTPYDCYNSPFQKKGTKIFHVLKDIQWTPPCMLAADASTALAGGPVVTRANKSLKFKFSKKITRKWFISPEKKTENPKYVRNRILLFVVRLMEDVTYNTNWLISTRLNYTDID